MLERKITLSEAVTVLEDELKTQGFDSLLEFEDGARVMRIKARGTDRVIGSVTIPASIASENIDAGEALLRSMAKEATHIAARDPYFVSGVANAGR